MDKHAEDIAAQYARRRNTPGLEKRYGPSAYNSHLVKEREARYARIIRQLGDPGQLRLLEIGAGTGANIPFFLQLGIAPEHLHANELLPERVRALRQAQPAITIHPGNALDIPQALDGSFHIVFQSTVFTSVLQAAIKQQIARRMWALLRPGGLILWYDFTFDNPANPDVKGVGIREIKRLFPEAPAFRLHRVTLAPPIGRRVGVLYPLFNALPLLRTHLAGAIGPKVE